MRRIVGGVALALLLSTSALAELAFPLPDGMPPLDTSSLSDGERQQVRALRSFLDSFVRSTGGEGSGIVSARLPKREEAQSLFVALASAMNGAGYKQVPTQAVLDQFLSPMSSTALTFNREADQLLMIVTRRDDGTSFVHFVTLTRKK